MPNPKEVHVDVIAKADASSPDGVSFNLSSNLGANDRLKFSNDKHPGFIVNFNLKDDDNTGVKFLSQPEDAMWVRTFDAQTPDPCPRCEMYWDQFKAIDVKKNNKQLVVRNLNQYEQLFAFSLRFSKPGSADPILYDPIGENENGGGGEISALAYVGGALLVGGLVFAAVKAFND